MPAAIKIQVVAFPGTPYRRLRPELEKFQAGGLPENLALRFVQSRNDYIAEIGAREVNEIAENVQAGYVHIAAFPTRDMPALRPFELDCRVIKLVVSPNFRTLTADEVGQAVLQATDYEERWCQVVRPDDWHHPLCLPRPSFGVHADIHDYWKTCDCYKETSKLTTANDVLQKVISRHRGSQKGEGTYWVDTHSRRFKVDRALHGMTAAQRNGRKSFRFAWEVPMGFHYDVRHTDEGKKFSIQAAAMHHHGCIRANVNCWGEVWVKV